jgi:hypothetical protein
MVPIEFSFYENNGRNTSKAVSRSNYERKIHDTVHIQAVDQNSL